jgi:hypothetical protein
VRGARQAAQHRIMLSSHYIKENGLTSLFCSVNGVILDIIRECVLSRFSEEFDVLPIPPPLQAEFEDHLQKKAVPKENRGLFKKWLRYNVWGSLLTIEVVQIVFL